MELIPLKWLFSWDLNGKIYDAQVVEFNTLNRFQKKSAKTCLQQAGLCFFLCKTCLTAVRSAGKNSKKARSTDRANFSIFQSATAEKSFNLQIT